MTIKNKRRENKLTQIKTKTSRAEHMEILSRRRVRKSMRYNSVRKEKKSSIQKRTGVLVKRNSKYHTLAQWAELELNQN